MNIVIDETLAITMAQWLFAISALVFILSLKILAWYGRFYTKESIFSLSSRAGWFLQECPSFFMPVIVYSCALISNRNVSITNLVLLGLFLVHYTQRLIIY